MKYVITGGAGNISLPLSLALLQAGHQVTVISRNASNIQELTAAGAVAAIGSLTDVAFLTETFSGADAVYTMVPPMTQVSDWKAAIAGIGKNYAEAIKRSGVKYVVNLSSVGAHMPEGAGPVSGIHFVEKALNELQEVNIKHLRPPFFYNNLLANVGMVKHMGIIGANYALPEGKFPIVSPLDIAAKAAEALLALDFKGHSVSYFASEEVSTDRIAKELGKAVGKTDLKWVQFTDEQALEGMIQAGLPVEIAKNYAEMNQALHSGEMTADYFRNRPSSFGKVKLTDFAQTFANVYNA